MSIAIEHVAFGYSKGNAVLHDLNLAIREGEFVLIVGPNGAGKSTLLKLLNGILRPDAGDVVIDGFNTRRTPTSELASHISVTFQNPADQLFASTVKQEVLFGPQILRRPNPALLTERSLAMFELDEFASKHPYDLSLAHRKLLTAASAVATDAPILAFDEPSAFLSQPERLTLLHALQEISHQGRTIIAVSHDLDLFLPVVSKLVVLSRGGIRHIGQPDDLLSDPRIARQAEIKVPLPLRLQRLTFQQY